MALKMDLTRHDQRSRFPNYLLAASVAGMILGPFLPWAAAYPPPSINRSPFMFVGIEGDGKVVIALALILLVGTYVSFRRPLERGPLTGMLLAGLAALAVTVVDGVGAADVLDSFRALRGSANFEFGIYLTAAGAIGASIGTLMLLVTPRLMGPLTGTGGSEAHSATQDSDLDDLERLSALHDRGVLTDEEFAAKKRQILGP